jgi:hypothetical protein
MSERPPEFTPANLYGAVDPAISAWVAEHGLQLFKSFKDYEGRSVDIARPRQWFRTRSPFQIWVDVPDAGGFLVVHAWDRSKQKFEHRTRAEGIRSALDAAMAWVQSQLYGK